MLFRIQSQRAIFSLLVCLVSSFVLVGCQTSQPAYDPFAAAGPQRIPPPATGSAGRAAPYYQSRRDFNPMGGARINQDSARFAVGPRPSLANRTRVTSESEQTGTQRPLQTTPQTTRVADNTVGRSSVRVNENLDWQRPGGPVRNNASLGYPTQPRPRFPGYSPQVQPRIKYHGSQIGNGGRAQNPWVPEPQFRNNSAPLTEITELAAMPRR